MLDAEYSILEINADAGSVWHYRKTGVEHQSVSIKTDASYPASSRPGFYP
jgi:hypothetical protein